MSKDGNKRMRAALLVIQISRSRKAEIVVKIDRSLSDKSLDRKNKINVKLITYPADT